MSKKGTCIICGCDDLHACKGGCSWVNNQHTLCSECFRKNKTVAFLVHESGRFEVIKPKNEKFTLTELQTVVGGLIEVGPIRANYNHLIIFDEEGRLKGKKINSQFRQQRYVGKVLVCPEDIFD